MKITVCDRCGNPDKADMPLMKNAEILHSAHGDIVITYKGDLCIHCWRRIIKEGLDLVGNAESKPLEDQVAVGTDKTGLFAEGLWLTTKGVTIYLLHSTELEKGDYKGVHREDLPNGKCNATFFNKDGNYIGGINYGDLRTKLLDPNVY
jgi:hypothetical protein